MTALDMSTGQIRAEVDRLGGELDDIAAFEDKWATGSRKRRISELSRQLKTATIAEVQRKHSLKAEITEADAAIEQLYPQYLAQVAALEVTGDSLLLLRNASNRLRREAKKLDMKLPPKPSDLGMRAVADRSVRGILYSLRRLASTNL